jgi:DNA-directed RNA polymerase specialized sigma24 family protein
MQSELIFKTFTELLNTPHKKAALLRYAEKQLVRRRIGGRTLTAEDVISELMTKLAYGERLWDPASEPNLYRILFLMIKSYVLNVYDKERKSARPAFDGMDDEEYEEYYFEYIDTNCISKQDDVWKDFTSGDRMLTIYLSRLDNDDECGLVLMGLNDGQSRREIADDLCVSVQKVNSIIDRVRKKLHPLELLRKKQVKEGTA